MNRLVEKYRNEIVPNLQKEFNYSNVMEVPALDKIVVNMGVGDATSNSKLLEAAMKDLEIITGQKPVATKAKKAIADNPLSKPSRPSVILTAFVVPTSKNNINKPNIQPKSI